VLDGCSVFPAHGENLCGYYLIYKLFRLLFISLFFGPLLIGAWWYRGPLLTGVAKYWVVSSPPVKADAIVVLGGGLETRPAAAVRLYREGWAKKILVMQPELQEPKQGQERYDEAALCVAALKAEKVQESHIILVEPHVKSTYDEASAIAAWAKKNNAKSFLIPTDTFHTRRAGWIFHKLMKEIAVTMIEVPPRRFSIDDWWSKEEGLLSFQSEFLKYGWYRCRY
jgi:uncharacterized SAM-binding protein YcdF (DUF218 family)